MISGPTLEGHGGLLTPDDAQTSLPSNMDLESVSELADDVSPLFLHLTCTVRSKGKSSSCSVRVLPTCLCKYDQWVVKHYCLFLVLLLNAAY